MVYMKEGNILSSFSEAISIILKRPFILFYFSFIMLVYCVLSYIITGGNAVLYHLLAGFGLLGGGDTAENIIYIMRFAFNAIFNTARITKILVYYTAFLLLFSTAASLLLSGYFYIVNNSTNSKPKEKGEYFAGLRKYYLRVIAAIFVSMLTLSLTIILIAVAAVPAVVVTSAALGNNPELVPRAVLLDLLTLFVLFFTFMFLRMYIFFWFPSIFNNERKAFKLGKRTVDSRFFQVLSHLLAFDVVFIIYQWLEIFMSNHYKNDLAIFVLFIVNWAFKSIFFVTLVSYVFAIYKRFNSESATADSETLH